MKRRIFARYKVLDKNSMRIVLKRNPKKLGIPDKEFEEGVLCGIIGDIISSREIILREEQRIQKASRAFKNWFDVIYEHSSKKIREAGTQYYSDRKRYLLNELESRVSKKKYGQ